MIVPGQMRSSTRPDRVQQHPSAHEPPSHRRRRARGRRSAQRVSSVTPTPATSTNVAAKRVESGPFHGSNSCGGPSVADRELGAGLVGGDDEVAVEVHHDHADQGDGADDVGAGEATFDHVAGRSSRFDVQVGRRQSHSNSSTSGHREWPLDVDSITDSGQWSAGGYEAHRRVHVRRLVESEPLSGAKWNGLRPSSRSAATPCAVPAPIITRWPSADRSRRGDSRPARRPHRGARRARRRSVGASPCRRARAPCRDAGGSGVSSAGTVRKLAMSRWLTHTGNDGSTSAISLAISAA